MTVLEGKVDGEEIGRKEVKVCGDIKRGEYKKAKKQKWSRNSERQQWHWDL